jgi:putative ABC transport system permease protein
MKAVEHRAAARIAWRYARKAKARTALVLFLIALPIAALVATGIVIKTVITNPGNDVIAQMGSADILIVDPPVGEDVAHISKALPAGTRVDMMRQVTAYKVARGTLVTLNVIEHSVPGDISPVAAEFKVFAGRVPHTVGEASLPPATARALGVRIGDTLRLDGLKHPVQIVGLSVLREDLKNNALLVGPGTLNGVALDGFPGFLVDLPAGTKPSDVFPAMDKQLHVGGIDRETLLQGRVSDEKRLTGLSFAAAVVALFGTGMIVVTAFGVGARRQLRAHGLVAATGGEPRHVHAIVLWGGVLLGFVGSALGLIVAVAAAYILTPHLNGVANRIIEGVRVPWWIVVGGIVLGTLASTIAALAPARQAAQISALDALAGRTPHPRAPGRLARRGGLGVLIGCGFTVIATFSHEWTLLAIALIVTMTGFLFAIPLLVSFVGRWSAHFPAIPRLAARQTARYGRRTGAAVAAATLALTAPIALSTLILSHSARDNRQAIISNDQMLLNSTGSNVTELSGTLIDAARAALPGSVIGRVRYAMATLPYKTDALHPEQPVLVSGPPQSVGARTGGAPQFTINGGELFVGDADVLRAAHAEAGIPLLSGDRIIAAGLPTDNGVLHLEFPSPGEAALLVRAGVSPSAITSQAPDGSATVNVAAISVGGGTGLGDPVPRYFIPAHLLKKYAMYPGLTNTGLLRGPHVLTKPDIRRVKHAVSLIPGGYAQAQSDYIIDSTPMRLGMTGGAMALALIIVAVAVSLVGAESRREQAILSAVGAAPGVRRRMVGANAFLMTALAGVLAVPAGLVPIALILISERPRQPVPVSWAIVGMVSVGAPLIAGRGAALVSRQPKSRAMLQPNW